jgi:chromosome segregation protein
MQILTESASGAIRAHVRRYADAKAFTERLREALSGSTIRRERIESLGAAIVEAENPQEKWARIIEEFETLATFDPDQEGAERRPDTPTLVSGGMTAADLDRIARKLSAEEWLALSLIEIESNPIFEYRSRENDYIPFSNASAGQQATALLKTLLNQPGPPLLIDQPEEDLDNPVIQEIVEQLWRAKQNRQIMFVSHNANLVVNGDAELVAWCDYRKPVTNPAARLPEKERLTFLMPVKPLSGLWKVAKPHLTFVVKSTASNIGRCRFKASVYANCR